MTDRSEGCPVVWQTRVVSAACTVQPDTLGIIAAWLGGSLASGTADRYSDVDLNCLVQDDDLPFWRNSWPSVVERCAGRLVLATPSAEPSSVDMH